MSGFVRPEAAARLRRWREPALWALVLAAGIWLVWQGYRGLAPLTFALGLAALVAGAGLLRPALRRLRLAAAPAAGVVGIDEARIGYFAPTGGGFVDLPALVAVDVRGGPSRAWILHGEDAVLTIPFGARGAEALHDALSALPGIDLDAAAMPRGGIRRIWSREGSRRARLG